VKFVAGTNATLASGCNNGSITVAYVADPSLSALVSSSVTTNTTTSSPSGTSSVAAASSTKAGAAMATFGSMDGVLSLLVSSCMVALGAVLLI
jgi:hypothetical protein